MTRHCKHLNPFAGSRPRRRLPRLVTGAVAALGLGVVACSDPVAVQNRTVEEHLLFLSTRDGVVDELGRPMSEIYRTTSDGSGAVNLTQQPSTYRALSVSPDGGRVMFARPQEGCNIWVMNTDGSDLKRLTGNSGAEGCNTQPRPSPDGLYVAFVSNRERRQVGSAIGVYDVWAMNADGSSPRNVSQSLGPELGSNVHVIGWSPGGQVVFETSDGVAGSVRRVYVVNADGTGMEPLFERTGDYAPSWSPDGSKIAFISGRSGRRQLYVMNADGSGVRALTNHEGDDRLPPGCCGFVENGSAHSPWSPDGRRIAFERFASLAEWGTMYTIGADGTDLRRIVPFSSSFNGWSPSGTRIALTRRDGSADVYVVDPDGQGLRNVTNSASEDSDAVWVSR